MSVTIAGISTLGVTFGYGTSNGSAKPSAFTQLDRIVSLGGISMDTEKLDCSTLEDLSTKYIAGRADTGGTWEVVVNVTTETIAEWKSVISAYNSAKADNNNIWFEVIVPNTDNAFFVVAEPPQVLPFPEMGSNEVMQMTVSLAVVEYKGEDTKVAFS